MEHNIIYKIIAIVTIIIPVLCSCSDLNLNSPSTPSVETWFSSAQEIEMSLNDLYRLDFWPMDNDSYTDDWTNRQSNSDIVNGILNGQNGDVTTLWQNQYKAIARLNTILAELKNSEKLSKIGISDNEIDQYSAEARFLRACMYSRLISHFGDVVWTVELIANIEEAFKMGRTPKSELISKVDSDFDAAASKLPVSYIGNSAQRATRGAALALKARFALYMRNWKTAADAAKACMDLGIYKLHNNFADLFLTTTKNADESIFVIPRSIEYKSSLGNYYVMDIISRNPGGWGSYTPSWDLLASFLCTDGLPIDKSPLFDPHNPFKNRDPRCTATIVPFGTKHLGFDYDPSPETMQVMNYNTGKMQINNDSRVNAQFASFNGLLWKKGVDETWLQNGKDADPDEIIIRYADVLLMYAESKIELNEIDQSVLDAINSVRARAYGVDKSETAKYPAVTTTDQTELRKIVRIERRMEFANEGLRYMDLVRWKLATKALSTKNYGMLYPASLLIDKVCSKGGWFWPETPKIDDDGIPDFSKMENEGLIQVLSQRSWNDRQYLWPIPTTEVLINKNLKQNEGY